MLADIDALDTLPRRELLAGYAEVVKYGLINDPAFFAWLRGDTAPALIAGDASARRHAIAHSCKAKAAIVGADEREAGARALLNLGHTFGHALEAECGYSDDLLHGEAVAIGMVMAFDLSARLGLCPLEDAARVQRHLAEHRPADLAQLDRRPELLGSHAPDRAYGAGQEGEGRAHRLRARPRHRPGLHAGLCGTFGRRRHAGRSHRGLTVTTRS